MRALALSAAALALAGTACGSSTSTVVPEKEEPIGRKQAAKGARDVILEAYASLKRGDVDGFQALAREDVFVIGPGVADVFANRTDAVVAVSGAFGHGTGKKHKLTSHELVVSASPAAHAAWAADWVEVDGVDYHFTAVLVEADEIWQLAAVHVARAGVARKGLAPKDLPGGGVRPGAAAIVDRFKEVGGDPATKTKEQLAEGKDPVIIGTSAKELTHGSKDLKKAWKKLFKRSMKLSPQGEAHAGIVPDGSLGWGVSNVDVSEDGEPPVRQRWSYVYVNEGNAWRLAALHASAVAP